MSFLFILTIAGSMKLLKYISFLLLTGSFFSSCNNKLEVNAPWKDITVVYALLNQNDSVHYIKITKAFLGEGNALSFANIADSSNYPDKLDVVIEEWRFNSSVDSSLHKTYSLDTTYIQNKEPGIFYYPTQLVYTFSAKLDTAYTYKLIITEKKSGKKITSQTKLIHKMNIKIPAAGNNTQANIRPGYQIPLEFTSSQYGRRYQLMIEFFYDEHIKHGSVDTSYLRSVQWLVFKDETASSLGGGELMQPYYFGDGLYSTLRNSLTKVYTADTNRVPDSVSYILTVGTDELNTYMNVTAPSTSIVQERPSFTNITNGIGLFTSRYDNTKDAPRHPKIKSGSAMADSIKAYSDRYHLGF